MVLLGEYDRFLEAGRRVRLPPKYVEYIKERQRNHKFGDCMLVAVPTKECISIFPTIDFQASAISEWLHDIQWDREIEDLFVNNKIYPSNPLYSTDKVSKKLKEVNDILTEETQKCSSNLRKLSGNDFEKLLFEILTSYSINVQLNVHVLGAEIDLLLLEFSEQGKVEFKVIECKHQMKSQKSVGISQIMRLYGLKEAIRNTNVFPLGEPLIVSTTGFSHNAKQFARVYGVDLMNYRDFLEWVTTHNLISQSPGYPLFMLINMDKYGRLWLPRQLASYIQAGTEPITIIGGLDYIELWKKTSWEKEWDDAKILPPSKYLEGPHDLKLKQVPWTPKMDADVWLGKVIERDISRWKEYPPKSPELLCHYAIFLNHELKDYDLAEETYIRAINYDPNNVASLKYYAIFLRDIRKNYDKAQELYIRAVELEPQNADILCSYANFLCDIRKNYDKAEEMYIESINYDPSDANIFKCYAIFLRDIRKNYDKAEASYIKAIELDWFDPYVLSSYAYFLYRIRNNYDKAEELYLEAIKRQPNNPYLLNNYAIFCKTRKDYNRAEKFYLRAIELEPDKALFFGSYAIFLWEIRNNYDGAGEYYNRALAIDSNDATNLGNYAGFLLSQGKADKGLSVLERVFPLLNSPETPIGLAAECWFYAFAHRSFEQRDEALRNLKRILQSGERSPNWNLAPNIVQARKDRHPDVMWLEKLAAVITEGSEIGKLNTWTRWLKA
jgi:Tfp pilus assembly protein PilF/DNA-binding transcriptional regulator/RsmH inhibitor MraZ